MTHPLTDALPSYMGANALRQACGEIEERLTRERDEAHAALKVKGEYGYSQHVVDALTKERDALRAEVERLRGGFERHALKAGECPPDSVVVLVSSMRRLAALQEPTP